MKIIYKDNKVSYMAQDGAALMLVLWVLVILYLLGADFVNSMRTEIKIVTNYKEDMKAYYAAIAGIELAKTEIRDAKGQMFLNNEGKIVNVNNKFKRSGKFDDVEFSYQILDEDSKLNINTIKPEQLNILLARSGLSGTDSQEIMDSIQDWIDKDNMHRINGAEDDYYLSLKEPYSCKDGPLDTVDELLLVKGMTEEILYGEPDNKEKKGIAPYLTIFDVKEININTADPIVIEMVLGAEASANILLSRQRGPITEPLKGGVVQSRFYTIISKGKYGKIQRFIKITVELKEDDFIVRYWNDDWIEV